MNVRLLVAVSVACLSCGGDSTNVAIDAPPSGDGGDGDGATDDDGSTDAADMPTVLPLGTVTAGNTVTCPTGAAPGATCRRFTVACPGTPDVGGVLAVASPVAPVGTVVMIFGGPGTRFFDEGFPAGYLANRLRVVQMQFDGATVTTGWISAGGAGIKAAACRPSTLIRWAFDNVHMQDRSRGFCAHGHSGGSGAVSYAVAHYGLADILDLVFVDAGPVFGRIDRGCEPALEGSGQMTRYLCPQQPAAPFFYSTGAPQTLINNAEGTSTCAAPYGDSTVGDQATWAAHSVVSPGADYDYPDTKLSFWYCANNSNEATGQGSYFVERVTSEKTVTCVTGSCTVEPAWTDPAAKQSMIDAMAADCIPRHP